MELEQRLVMARKRKTPDQRLLDRCLAELVILIKDVSPPARVEISFEQYEDEDAHIWLQRYFAGDGLIYRWRGMWITLAG
jgi:hypothetical protein